MASVSQIVECYSKVNFEFADYFFDKSGLVFIKIHPRIKWAKLSSIVANRDAAGKKGIRLCFLNL